ncbi:MAG: hypothetical protein QM710_13885 [Flavobacterium sp.]
MENKIKYLGIYQLLGGIIGTLSALRFVRLSELDNGGILAMYLIIFGLFFFSGFCGYALLKKRYLSGLNLSIYNQLIQTIGFGILGYGFHFTAGIYAGIKINLTYDTIMTFMLGHSSGMINWNINPEFTEISINFIALLLINFIFNWKAALKKNLMEGKIKTAEA